MNPFWACWADRKVGGVGRQAVDALLRCGAFCVSVAGLATAFAVSFAVATVLGVVVPAVLALRQQRCLDDQSCQSAAAKQPPSSFWSVPERRIKGTW